MYGKFFGHFLRENRVITNSQLKRLLEMQRREHRPFGVMAIEFGFLSADQVQEIANRQQDSEKRFGEVAAEMDLLSQDQIERLTQAQVEQHMLIGQLAVEQGLLDLNRLEALLARFYSENTRLDSEIQQRIEHSSDSQITTIALWTIQRLFSRVFRGTVKGVECLDETPSSGRLDQVLSIYLRCPGHGLFGQGLVLRKPLIYSLIYCLLGRETSSERLIRETLREFGWDLLKSEVNSLTRQGTDCLPHGVEMTSELPPDSDDGVTILFDGPTGPFPCRLFRPVSDDTECSA